MASMSNMSSTSVDKTALERQGQARAVSDSCRLAATQTLVKISLGLCSWIPVADVRTCIEGGEIRWVERRILTWDVRALRRALRMRVEIFPGGVKRLIPGL